MEQNNLKKCNNEKLSVLATLFIIVEETECHTIINLKFHIKLIRNSLISC